MYRAIATRPSVCTSGLTMVSSRHVGPFSSRGAAEQAAIRLADDPARYQSIRVVVAELADDEEDEDTPAGKVTPS